MNILFLGLSTIDSFNKQSIYADLMRALINNGNNVFSVTAAERRQNVPTHINTEGSNALLIVKTYNIQKTNIIEKGIGTLLIKEQYKRAIEKYFKGIKFDLILYPTPPITLYEVVKYFKKRDNAKTYLMLKDIFPQNAIDLGLMKKTGLKGIISKYFRNQEKRLYSISDKIGCMSPANVEYVLNHNPDIQKDKVEVFPNCIEVREIELSDDEKVAIREKYDLPLDKKIFIYGGNLGKPQGIPFIIDCLKAERNNPDAFFLIVGDGTEYGKLEQYSSESKQVNFKLIKRLPSEEFDRVLVACDVGLIFLDHRFTIPNFPSRLLSYMQAGLPVLACTDTTTDVGKVIVNGGFGWWCLSNDVFSFHQVVRTILSSHLIELKANSKKYLIDNYSIKWSCALIDNIREKK